MPGRYRASAARRTGPPNPSAALDSPPVATNASAVGRIHEPTHSLSTPPTGWRFAFTHMEVGMTTRQWWRLDEVLHLAEHATAAPQHRRTRAQVAAHAVDRPALIWNRTADGDELTSNGLPGWYDDHRRPHRVPADGWHHPATGRRGVATRDTDADGWLPLTIRPRRHGREPLIDRLRRGPTAGALWFVLDTRPTATARIQLLDHRDEIAPPHVRWIPGTVTADVLAGVEYPALIADGYTALGGVLARFDRTTVELIAADLAILRAGAMPGEHPSVGLRGDVAVVAWDHDTGARATAPEMDQVHPDHGGRYSLGAYLWPWRAVESRP
jgi:hypothetical protein